MGTSELSDALNPSYAVPYRNRPPQNPYPEPHLPVVQAPQQHVPHRSELELAISEPQPPPPARQTQPSAGGVQAVHELLRIVSATSQAQEIERKRRIAWEQEQEAKYAQRQAETERQLFELRQELVTLRSMASGNTQRTPGASPSLSSIRNMSISQQMQSASPISPVPQPPGVHYPTFVQGSSSQPNINFPQQYAALPAQHQQPPPDEPVMSAMTPSPSPAPKQRSPNTTSKTRKKRRASFSSSEESDSGSSDSDSSRDRKKQRRNRHDKRCITIHHAMRTHMLLLMDIFNPNNLPDSHIEGQSLKDTDPVRFVWDKTAKQSVHNARMKARVIASIKEKRRRYKDVPEGEFSKKNLDSAFDQCFTTFRQKFKAQRDDREAEHAKAREKRKAQKSRHISRKKTAFEHIAFDGAFQLECMSSDDSDSEDDGLLCSRGYPWRSKRLIRLYEILDKEDVGDKASKPKRGVGKKDRTVGPLKEGFCLPPKGVASWMVSRRWIAETQLTRSDLPHWLESIVNDLPDFDSTVQKCVILGDDSDDDEYFQRTNSNTASNLQPLPSMHYSITNNSSLQYALS
ncbi:hypothetical protein EDD18DRAFT_1158480 [Armillaria luteobubalina]|uniref:Uncharacterized protein n=1 Tax=Armillaria luteobubalina TaxID=153913 RepID=A0AA39QB25_9AGAR|nr:hypothetical protein EDD18DRAFT_1158480 [Armillaria luteobubalina]